MTGVWTPTGTWHRVHGDGKSTTGGKFHLETMTKSAGGCSVRVVSGGKGVATLEYQSQPSFETIVADLQREHG